MKYFLTILLVLCSYSGLQAKEGDEVKLGTTAEEAFDDRVRKGEENLKEYVGLGVIFNRKCQASLSNMAAAITDAFICSIKGKHEINIRLQFRCKSSGEIGEVSELGNYSINWKTENSSGVNRTDPKGKLYIYTKVSNDEKYITFRSKLFTKRVNMLNGPYEIWLEQKECGGTSI